MDSVTKVHMMKLAGRWGSEEDVDMIVGALELASARSLDRSPRKNWVENEGGLPRYVREVANAILRENPQYSISRAISIAIGRIKRWIVSPNTTAATKAKATAAIAQWTKMRASAAAKRAAK